MDFFPDSLMRHQKQGNSVEASKRSWLGSGGGKRRTRGKTLPILVTKALSISPDERIQPKLLLNPQEEASNNVEERTGQRGGDSLLRAGRHRCLLVLSREIRFTWFGASLMIDGSECVCIYMYFSLFQFLIIMHHD